MTVNFPWRAHVAPIVAQPAVVDNPIGSNFPDGSIIRTEAQDLQPSPIVADVLPRPSLPPAAQAEPTEAPPMSFATAFTSALSAVGKGLKAFFTGAVKVAEAAEPLIGFLFPGTATLYDSIVTAVASAEASAIAAGSQNGTGAQKLALVVASVESAFTAYEKQNNITVPHTQEQITAAVNGVVAFLNALTASPTA